MNFYRKYSCVLLFLLLWELLSRLALINPVFFPPLSAILQTAFQPPLSGTLPEALWASLSRALPGFLIATLAGVPLGLALGVAGGSLKELSAFPLEVFSQVNPFLLFHVLILFMGIGEAPKIAIVAWSCLWPTLFGSMNAALSVNPSLIKAGRAMGLSRAGLLAKIVFPAGFPLVLASLRLSLGYSLFMLIAAEMMGASSGLGFLALNSQETFQLRPMYASVLVIALVGLALDASLRLGGRLYRGRLPEERWNSPGD
ncbi:MAG: ABC transporter permease subunit [Deltaproteobacteria bacterium]|jgi:NitT/TauT family transport system permease protein|nr:ABC transporter permease subunit [Deltaproteobacteria bacterium]